MTITPAQRKPMPVTTPPTTRVASGVTSCAVPPYHSGAKPTKIVSAVEAMHTSAYVRIPAARPLNVRS